MAINKNVRYINIAKAIGIYLVVLGHCLEVSYSESEAVLHTWIYSFHMPLFFFLSGYGSGCSAIKENENQNTTNVKMLFHGLIQYIIKKIKQLYIPYFLCGLVFATSNVWKNVICLLYASYFSIRATGGVTSLWFLPCYLIATVLFHCIKNHLKSISGILITLLVFMLSIIANGVAGFIEIGLPCCLDSSLMGVVFMSIGYWFSELFDVKIYGCRNKISVAVSCCLLGFLATLLCFVNIPESFEYVRMASGTWGDPLLFIVTGVGGSIMICSLSFILDYRLCVKKEIFLNKLSYVGTITLFIMCVHKPIIQLVGRIAEHLTWVPILFPVIVSAFIIIFLVLIRKSVDFNLSIKIRKRHS